MERKAFVLLSGGLDSTTCLHQAIMDYFPKESGARLMYGDPDLVQQALRTGQAGDLEIPWVEAISIDYGQRHKKEMIYAAKTCARLGIQHTILDVGALLSGKSVMLSQDSIGSVDVPDIAYSDIKGVSPTYVPFRNGLLLSAITAQAQKYVNQQIANAKEDGLQELDWQLDDKDVDGMLTRMARDMCGVYFGAHADDALNRAYPDCTPEFIGAFANAIYVGSYFTIRLHTPIMWDLKADVVRRGQRLGVDFENTWSCYKGEHVHCGICPTCRSRKEAFMLAKVTDPTEYADNTGRYQEPCI